MKVLNLAALVMSLASCTHVDGVASVSAVPSPSTFTVLRSEFAKSTIVGCGSRWFPSVTGSWDPSSNDIAKLEQDLSKLVGMTDQAGRKLDNVGAFYRQYVGAIVEGHQYVYVNAIPSTLIETSSETTSWRTEPVTVCDGGPEFWGVFYDPTDREFSGLSFNGGLGKE